MWPYLVGRIRKIFNAISLPGVKIPLKHRIGLQKRKDKKDEYVKVYCTFSDENLVTFRLNLN